MSDRVGRSGVAPMSRAARTTMRVLGPVMAALWVGDSGRARVVVELRKGRHG